MSPEPESQNLSPGSVKDVLGPAGKERQEEFMNDGYVLDVRAVNAWRSLSMDTINQKVTWLK